MVKQGKKKKEVAQTFRVSVNTITNWVKRYKAHGSKRLADNVRRARGQEPPVNRSGCISKV